MNFLSQCNRMKQAVRKLVLGLLPRPKTNKKLFRERCDRLVASSAIKYHLDFIVAHEMLAALKAYYGSIPRMFYCITVNGFRDWKIMARLRFLIWLSDFMGWTRLIHCPQDDQFIAHDERHGRQCDGNCGRSLKSKMTDDEKLLEEDCIERSQPKWFRKLYLD